MSRHRTRIVNGHKITELVNPADWSPYCRAPLTHTGGNCAKQGKFLVLLGDGAQPKRCLQHAEDLARAQAPLVTR